MAPSASHLPLITIRLVQKDDFQAWLGLWDQYLTFYKKEIAHELKVLTFERIVNQHRGMHGVFLEDDGVPVGLTHYIYHPSTWTEGDYCYLPDLIVVGDRRGMGYGRRLIQHVYDAAMADNCSRVYWLTHESNEVAIRLYERVAENAGFIQYRKDL